MKKTFALLLCLMLLLSALPLSVAAAGKPAIPIIGVYSQPGATASLVEYTCILPVDATQNVNDGRKVFLQFDFSVDSLENFTYKAEDDLDLTSLRTLPQNTKSRVFRSVILDMAEDSSFAPVSAAVVIDPDASAAAAAARYMLDLSKHTVYVRSRIAIESGSSYQYSEWTDPQSLNPEGFSRDMSLDALAVSLGLLEPLPEIDPEAEPEAEPAEGETEEPAAEPRYQLIAPVLKNAKVALNYNNEQYIAFDADLETHNFPALLRAAAVYRQPLVLDVQFRSEGGEWKTLGNDGVSVAESVSHSATPAEIVFSSEIRARFVMPEVESGEQISSGWSESVLAYSSEMPAPNLNPFLLILPLVGIVAAAIIFVLLILKRKSLNK